MKFNKGQLYIPFILIIGFNIFTYIIFITAPFDWSKGDPLMISFFLFINYFAINLGYRVGVRKVTGPAIPINTMVFSSYSRKVTHFIFIFYSLTFLIKYAYFLRFPILDVQGMFSYLLLGFIDPQLGYNLSVYDTRPHTVSWFLYTGISIVTQLFFIYGFLTWKKLNFLIKLVFIFFLGLEVFYWLGRGTGFGVMTLLTTLVACVLAQRKIKSINYKNVLVFLALFLVGVGTFGYLKKERAGSEDVPIEDFNSDSAPVDKYKGLILVMPEPYIQTYMHSVSYLAQGYYHMGLAMKYTDFTPTFFMGNNPSSLSLMDSLGVDMWEHTYMNKLYLSQGIDDLAKWHSAYLWYANDVSFFGVPVIIYFISLFLAMAYAMVIRYDDLLSKVLFVLLMNMLLYLFANNSYLSFHYYSLIVVFTIWYITRVAKFKSRQW